MQGHGDLAAGEGLPDRVIVGLFGKGRGWGWAMTDLFNFSVHPINVCLICRFNLCLHGLADLILNLPLRLLGLTSGGNL